MIAKPKGFFDWSDWLFFTFLSICMLSVLTAGVYRIFFYHASPKPPIELSHEGLIQYRDEVHHVTCYRVELTEGLSCLHDSPAKE